MKHIKYERQDNVGILKLSRVEALNALNKEMLEEILMFLDLMHKSRQIKALIVIGEGDKAFAAGADIKEMQKMNHLEMLELSELGQKVANAFQNAEFLTIAAVNGYALGGGFEMALACDFIYATDNSIFGLPEVKLGLIPGFGGTQRLTEAVGPRLAKEWIMTGKTITAKEALDLQIVNKLVSKEALITSCYETASLVLKNPFHAVMLAKKAVNVASSLKSEGFKTESHMCAVCFATPERQKQMDLFIQQKDHHESK